ncbi:hypothetical protein ACOME3_002552 [Neoechinorhynchus agilis]
MDEFGRQSVKLFDLRPKYNDPSNTLNIAELTKCKPCAIFNDWLKDAKSKCSIKEAFSFYLTTRDRKKQPRVRLSSLLENSEEFLFEITKYEVAELGKNQLVQWQASLWVKNFFRIP